MAIDPTKASILQPLVKTDNVLWADSLSPQIDNSIGFTTITTDVSKHVVSNWGLVPIGIYSYDGGVTWQDCNITTRDLPGLAVEVNLTANTSQLVSLVRVVSTVGGGATIPVQIFFCLLPPPQDSITNLHIDDALVKQITSYNSTNPVPKIAFKGAIPVGLVDNPISHNLGYIPDVFVYYSDWQNGVAGEIAQNEQPSTNGYQVNETILSIVGHTSQITWYEIYYKDGA